MSNEVKLDEFRIFTNNPVKIEDKVIKIDSAREGKEFPHACNFTIHKITSSRDDKIKVEFDIQMTFDPDGSRLKIFLDANEWKNYEFVKLLKSVKYKEWGNINMKFEDEKLKGKHVMELIFNTFHGDDPYKIQIRDLKIG
ncbi:MAG: hypothetical protein EAX96_15785 [Candidatus Lokiarchaeota archaeon]|nr:hypothetical protein [Candidatus Lokiarchaeota archaeon]